MSTPFYRRTLVWAACIFALSQACLRADQLQMQNGDHYIGQILSVTSNSVVLQSENLGKVTLPREKVTVLMFGASTNAAKTARLNPASPAAPGALSATNADLSAAFHSLGANTNFIQQIRGQMLAGSAPEANQKFDDLLDGLMTGKLNLNDLRDQAKTSIDQINDLKRQLGPEADSSLDSYLSILQGFVNETAPATAVAEPNANSQPAPQIK